MKFLRLILALSFFFQFIGVLNVHSAVKKDLKPLVFMLTELKGNRQIQIEFESFYITPDNTETTKGFLVTSFNSKFHKQTNLIPGVYQNWTAFFKHSLSGKMYSIGSIKASIIIKENAITILPFKTGYEIIGNSQSDANIKVRRFFDPISKDELQSIIDNVKKDFSAKKYPIVYLGDQDITGQVFDKK